MTISSEKKSNPVVQDGAAQKKLDSKITQTPVQPPGEQGGPKGPEPTRYGDWEVGGRCTDF